jgi:mRNA deadenylase 3'-5' endonuclease subunit Ccr4
MQEVDNWKDWETSLKDQGYTNAYLARGGSKQDGCSISFKSDRFVQVDRFEVRMDDIADLPFKDTQRIRKHCVALGLVLRPTDAPETSEGAHDFCLVTTHLFWNPKFEDVKLRQAIFLMYQISQYWNNPERLVLCGDFNSTPDSALATFLRSGSVDLRSWDFKSIVGRGGYHGKCESFAVFGLDDTTNKDKQIDPIDLTNPLDHEGLFQLLKSPVMSHPYRLRSAYHNFLNFGSVSSAASSSASSSSAPSSSASSQPHHHSNGSSGKGKKNQAQDANSGESGEPITSHFKQFSGTLDYILTSPGIYPISLLPLPTDKEMQEIGWLPNASFGSDHAILMAQLQIGTRTRQ